MSEPLRHRAGARNRRKILHNAECLLEEIEYIHRESIRREVNLKYAVHRAATLLNRIRSEVRAK